MSDEDDLQQPEPTPKQKKDIAKWFLANAPPGEIHYIAKDIQSIIADEDTYNAAVSEAYPLYNKAHMIALELPNRTGDVLSRLVLKLKESGFGKLSRSVFEECCGLNFTWQIEIPDV